MKSKTGESGDTRVFKTDRRIRLGIWGLGRGMSFFATCDKLNIDVVAGCDFNAHMRDHFLKCNPGAFVTSDAEEFLRQDFDAVLLATFFPAHAEDAIRCMRAGKHVLSEVAAFFTMDEGVRLVEEVRKTGKVYQLAENYPFTAVNMWLANRWREGLFGDLMYGEYEYVHECRSLAYTYIDGIPVQPGHTVHNWRSWFNFHYYCTHSLGPVMVITGTRPVAVEAFPSLPRIAGYLGKPGKGNGGMTPSLIQMSNGGVVRNLMGAGTNDSHQKRFWGTLGSCEQVDGRLYLRLGASGDSPRLVVKPDWEGLGKLAATCGHGGGDFWTLYYFAREILTGEPGPFDIYGACDVTIPGIQALRSSQEGGKPMEVPDFRHQDQRERYRGDDWQLPRYNVKRGVFGKAKLDERAARFSTVMNSMVQLAPVYRAYNDWSKVADVLESPCDFLPVAVKLLDRHQDLVATYTAAREIVDAYPGSDGAKVLREMLEIGDEKKVLDPSFLKMLKRNVSALRRCFTDGATPLTSFKCSTLLPAIQPIGKTGYPGSDVKFLPVDYNAAYEYADIRSRYAGRSQRDGLVYARTGFASAKGGQGRLRVGADGPYKVFVNRTEVACNPKATNPITGHEMTIPVVWKPGRNEIVLAMTTNGGSAWGFKVSTVVEAGRNGVSGGKTRARL